MADLPQATWAASRPVILPAGTVRAGARAELLRIGQAVGALCATTLLGKGLFADDPWSLASRNDVLACCIRLLSHNDGARRLVESVHNHSPVICSATRGSSHRP